MKLKEVVDAIIAVIFCSCLGFSGKEVYLFFKKEAVQSLQKGPSETLPLSRKLSGKRFSWEGE